MRIFFLSLAILVMAASCSKSKDTSTAANTGPAADTTVAPSTPPNGDPTTPAWLTTGYIGVNDNSLHNAGCYIMNQTGESLNFAIIFAANINADNNGKATLYFNPQTQTAVQSGDIAYLQSLGIKVLLSVLGNHEDAGWSCFLNYAAADDFAQQLAAAVTQYNLDGIDIDDEYSTCTANDSSLVIALSALRSRLGNKKYITKALYSDKQYFTYAYNGLTAGQILNYGWEMDYGNMAYNGRLHPYTKLGMAKTKLFLGVDPDISRDNTTAAKFVKDSSYAGVMLYDVTKNSQTDISLVTSTLFNMPTGALNNCLR